MGLVNRIADRLAAHCSAAIRAEFDARDQRLADVTADLEALYRKLRALEMRNHKNGGPYARLEVDADLDNLLRERKGFK